MDTTAYFEFTPNLGINSKNNSTFGRNRSYTDLKKLNDATGTGGNNENTLNYSHGFYIEKQLHKNHIVSFRNTISINTNEKPTPLFKIPLYMIQLSRGLVYGIKTEHKIIPTTYISVQPIIIK
jgi:hypothetical protein